MIQQFKKAMAFCRLPMKRGNLLFFLLLFSRPLWGQNSLGLKFFGLTVHPRGDKNAFLMPRKFDPEGVFVLNIGGMTSYEHFIHKDIFSIKGIQALYSDCAAKPGGFSHVGIRGKIFKSSKHSLYGGIGPTLIFRRNWSDLTGYLNSNRFKGKETNKYQHFFLWYGAELEYAYVLNKHIDLSVTFIPGYPDLLSLSLGIKHKGPKQEGGAPM
jgi:hypothetical protein